MNRKIADLAAVGIILLAVLTQIIVALPVIAQTVDDSPLKEIKIDGHEIKLGDEVKPQDRYRISFVATETQQIVIEKSTSYQLDKIADTDPVSQDIHLLREFKEEETDYRFAPEKDQQVSFDLLKKGDLSQLTVKSYLPEGTEYQKEAAYTKELFKVATVVTASSEAEPVVESSYSELSVENTTESSAEASAGSEMTSESSEAALPEIPAATTETAAASDGPAVSQSTESETAGTTDSTVMSTEEIASSSAESNTRESAEASEVDTTNPTTESTDLSAAQRAATDPVAKEAAAPPSTIPAIVAAVTVPALAAPKEANMTAEIKMAKAVVSPDGINRMRLVVRPLAVTPKANVIMAVIQLPHDATGNHYQMPRISYKWDSPDGQARNGVGVYYSMEEYASGPAKFYSDYLAAVSENQKSVPSTWAEWPVDSPIGVNPATMIITYVGGGGAAVDEAAIDFKMELKDAVSGWHFETRGTVFSLGENAREDRPDETDIPETDFTIAGFSLAGKVTVATDKTAAMTGKDLENQPVSLYRQAENGTWQAVKENTEAAAPKTALTDSTGHYQFDGLPAGTYRVGLPVADRLEAENVPVDAARENTDNKGAAIIDGELISHDITFNDDDLTEADLTSEKVAYDQMNLKLYQPNGSIALKLQAANDGAPLAGGSFQVLDAAGQQVTTDVLGETLPQVVTSDSGETIIDKLAPGNYRLVQVLAPTGYEVSQQIFDVTVTNDTQTAIAIANYKQALLPNTGNDGRTLQQLVGLAIAALLLSLILFIVKNSRLKFTWFLLLLATTGGLFFAASTSHAAETIAQNDFSWISPEEAQQVKFTVHKFGYSDSYTSQITPGLSDEEIQQRLIQDPQLKPLKDIQYRLVQIEATSNRPMIATDPASYRIKADGFQTTLTTDTEGAATVTYADGLVPGYYRISELPNQQVESRMSDKITAIPRTDDLGENLIFDVQMFPKEKLTNRVTPPDPSDPPVEPPTPPTPDPPTTGGDQLPPIPDAGGIISKITSALPKLNGPQKAGVMMVGLGLIFIAWWLLIWKRRKEEEQQ